MIEIIHHCYATEIILNQPEKHNAFDDKTIARLDAVFKELHQSPPNAVILSARGRSFSAGADLNWMKRMATYSMEANLQDAQALSNMLARLNTLPCPTIANVQGAAFGGAIGLISCCDIAIASDNALFAISEVKIGLIPATISPFVINAIGPRHARRYFCTGELFDAKTALSIQLIHEVTSLECLHDRVIEISKRIANNSPQACIAAKQLVLDYQFQPTNQHLRDDSAQRIADVRVSQEGQEGLAAFLEKRSPHWSSSHE